MAKDIRQRYLERYGRQEELPKTSKKLQVVIPAYEEHVLLPRALDSLNACERAEEARVIVVVNHGPEASAEVRASNDRVWSFMAAQSKAYKFELLALDGREVGPFTSAKRAGVGLARRVGLDSALAAFEGPLEELLLVGLDADCTVSSNYLTAIAAWGRDRCEEGVGTLAFAHPLPAEGSEDRRAIVTYELFLRYYVGGLRAIGHRYAHHSIGSAFVTRGSVYVAVRGMVLRKAAEDFYFLDKARKIAPIGVIAEALVSPAARLSERVIFGTGRFMLKSRESWEPRIFYDARSFDVIRAVRDGLYAGGEEERMKALGEAWGVDTWAYLQGRHWPRVRERLWSKGGRRGAGVDEWFDGLETLKLAHYLRDEVFTPLGALEAFSDLRARWPKSLETRALGLEEWLSWSRLNIP